MKKIAILALTAGFLATSNVNAATVDLDLGVGLPVIGMTAFSTSNELAPAVVGQLGLPGNVFELPNYVLALPIQLLGGSGGVGNSALGLPVVGGLTSGLLGGASGGLLGGLLGSQGLVGGLLGSQGLVGGLLGPQGLVGGLLGGGILGGGNDSTGAPN